MPMARGLKKWAAAGCPCGRTHAAARPTTRLNTPCLSLPCPLATLRAAYRQGPGCQGTAGQLCDKLVGRRGGCEGGMRLRLFSAAGWQSRKRCQSRRRKGKRGAACGEGAAGADHGGTLNVTT